MNALANQKKRPRGKRWGLKNKITSLAIYKRSPKAYRYMQKVLPLPSERTLQRMLKELHIQPGIYDNILNNLTHKTTQLEEQDKYCAILFDEIALKKRLIYNEFEDKVEGFVDHGPGEGMERTNQLADDALVFMIQGLRFKFKQPIGHYFVEGTISSQNVLGHPPVTLNVDFNFNDIEEVFEVYDYLTPDDARRVHQIREERGFSIEEFKAAFLQSFRRQPVIPADVEMATEDELPVYPRANPFLVSDVERKGLTGLFVGVNGRKPFLNPWDDVKAWDVRMKKQDDPPLSDISALTLDEAVPIQAGDRDSATVAQRSISK
ncbi:unnamed protein product [Colias eurytheme]|nr:unnamed protein product [Colias eurytheme]